MTITLPKDLEDWARAEVAAGRAQSVEAVAARALAGYRRALEDFRQSLDDAEAEADRDGWIPFEQFSAEVDRWIAEDEVEAAKQSAAE